MGAALKIVPLEPGPRQSLTMYSWWTLPSGQIVEARRIVGEHHPEVVVRNVNKDGELAPGEYQLTLTFLVRHGKQVRVAR
ncbi:hypothetical protein D3C86_1258690 [compost metagenome]